MVVTSEALESKKEWRRFWSGPCKVLALFGSVQDNCTRKKPLQETTLAVQLLRASRLVQHFLHKFLTVCHRNYVLLQDNMNFLIVTASVSFFFYYFE